MVDGDLPVSVWQGVTYRVTFDVYVKNVGWEEVRGDQGEETMEVLLYVSENDQLDVTDIQIPLITSTGRSL
jgi:hypothetical protein